MGRRNGKSVSVPLKVATGAMPLWAFLIIATAKETHSSDRNPLVTEGLCFAFIIAFVATWGTAYIIQQFKIEEIAKPTWRFWPILLVSVVVLISSLILFSGLSSGGHY